MSEQVHAEPPSAPQPLWDALTQAEATLADEPEEPPSKAGALRKAAARPLTARARQLDWTLAGRAVQALDPAAPRAKRTSPSTATAARRRKTRRLALVCNVRPEGLGVEGTEDEFEEYDSPATIAALAQMLSAEGYSVSVLEADRSLPRRLSAGNYDLVFNIAEGKGGRCREAHVPALCEMLGIAYTGSDPLTLSATLDKAVAKRLICDEVRTPRWLLARTLADLQRFDLNFPVFAKPNDEGSSKGIRDDSRCEDFAALESLVTRLLDAYGRPVLIEEYVAGPEVTVGVVGNATPEVVGMMHVVPIGQSAEDFIYSLEAKRDYATRVRYATPPELPDDVCKRIEAAALRAFVLLDCRDVARIDFRVGRDGEPYFIEANPLPGLSPTSGDIVLMARAMGWRWEALISRIVREAEFRQGVLRPILVARGEGRKKDRGGAVLPLLAIADAALPAGPVAAL